MSSTTTRIYDRTNPQPGAYFVPGIHHRDEEEESISSRSSSTVEEETLPLQVVTTAALADDTLIATTAVEEFLRTQTIVQGTEIGRSLDPRTEPTTSLHPSERDPFPSSWTGCWKRLFNRKRVFGAWAILLVLLVGGIILAVAVAPFRDEQEQNSLENGFSPPTVSPNIISDNSRNPEPTVAPTTSAPQRISYNSRQELLKAVDDYLLVLEQENEQQLTDTNGAGSDRNTSVATVVGLEYWDVSAISDFSEVFSASRNGQVARMLDFSGLNQWNTSRATTMKGMFRDAIEFNADLGAWDTSNVQDMSFLFAGTSNFDQNLSSWQTSKVTSMAYMFDGATAFSHDGLANWDTGRVQDMSRMFREASSFNVFVGNWSTVRLTNMYGMFWNAASFNQDLSSLNTSKVTDMGSLFRGATLFDRPIALDTSSVLDMTSMFHGATAFNSEFLSDTSKVSSMRWMFRDAVAFNQDISHWNVSNVITTREMFRGASSFQQNLCPWGEVAVSQAVWIVSTGMFDGTACNTTFVPILTANPPGPFCEICTSFI